MSKPGDDSYKLPVEWIDRIFTRFYEIYGDEFLNQFTNDRDYDLERLRWRSGLFGVTGDEVKKVINLCANGMIAGIPNVVEFFHYCKGFKQPSRKKIERAPRSEIGKRYLELIKDKLHGRAPKGSERDAALSALDQQILERQADKEKITTHWQDD